jgi:hypothetical protein
VRTSYATPGAPPARLQHDLAVANDADTGVSRHARRLGQQAAARLRGCPADDLRRRYADATRGRERADGRRVAQE